MSDRATLRNLLYTFKRLKVLRLEEYAFWDPTYNKGSGREVVHVFVNDKQVIMR